MTHGTDARRVLVVGECPSDDLKALNEAGFTVEVVASAADAYDRLRSGSQQAVLARVSQEVSTPAAPDFVETFFTAPAANWQAALLNDLAENTDANLAFLDRDFNYVWVNSAYCQKCGYARDELIGRNHFELFPHPEDKVIFEQVRDAGTPYRVRAKPFTHPRLPEQGITYWDWTLAPIRDETDFVGGLVLSRTDVTQVIRAHRETEHLADRLEAGRRFLSLILDNVDSAVSYLDDQRVFRQCNSAAAMLLGRPPKEVVGRELDEALSGGPGIWKSAGEVLRTGKPCRSETVKTPGAKKNSKTERYYLVSHVPDTDSTGRVRGVFTAASDVTDLVSVQKQLDADRAKLHAILENMGEGLVVVDAEGKLIDWNRSALAIHSLEAIEDAPDNLADYGGMFTLSRDDGHIDLAEWPFTRVASGEDISGMVLKLRHIGLSEERVVSFGGRMVRDRSGDPILAFLTLHDITEEHRAGNELKHARLEAESRALELESIISSMADGVALFGSDGGVVWANDTGRWMLGVPNDAADTDRLPRLEWRDMNDAPLDPSQGVAQRLLRGESLRDAQYRLTRASGESLAVSVSGAPLRGPHGGITSAVAVMRDMTERAELDRVRDELYEREHRIAQILQQAVVPPKINYTPPGCSFAVRYEPGSKEAEIGGDFYDVFEISEGKAGVVIGDVAGKGLPAAIRVAATRYAIRSYANLDLSPGAVMAFVNKAVCSEDLDEETSMLTAFFGIIDTAKQTLVFANGGHEPPLIRRADGSVTELQCEGIALGITTQIPYPEVTWELNPGDRVLLVTDGITEARSGGELYGKERVADYLKMSSGRSCDETAQGLMESAKAHAGGLLQDDAAILVFELLTDTD